MSFGTKASRCLIQPSQSHSLRADAFNAAPGRVFQGHQTGPHPRPSGNAVCVIKIFSDIERESPPGQSADANVVLHGGIERNPKFFQQSLSRFETVAFIPLLDMSTEALLAASTLIAVSAKQAINDSPTPGAADP